MEKIFVVKRLASKLWATEDAIDGALTEAAGLVSDLIAARRELKVSVNVIDPTTAKIADAMKALAEARSAMMAAHDAMYEAKLRIGVRTKLVGVTDKPPEDIQEAPLQRVV